MQRAKPMSAGGRSRPGVILAALLAVVAGVLVFAALKQASHTSSSSEGTAGPDVTVYVAAQDIPARTAIKPEMLQPKKVAPDALLAGALTSLDAAGGAVARFPIYKGEQVVASKITGSVQQSGDLGLSYIVPEGYRAMGVGVDKVIGAGGLVRPGDRVDVIAVVDVRIQDIASGREVTQTMSATIAQNVEVLAVEQAIENRAPGTGADGTTGQTPVDQPKADPKADVVTLALTPDETQAILLADEKGKIRLAVRAPGDGIVTPDRPTTVTLPNLFLTPEQLQQLLDQLGKSGTGSAPAPAPAASPKATQ